MNAIELKEIAHTILLLPESKTTKKSGFIFKGRDFYCQGFFFIIKLIILR